MNRPMSALLDLIVGLAMLTTASIAGAAIHHGLAALDANGNPALATYSGRGGI